MYIIDVAKEKIIKATIVFISKFVFVILLLNNNGKNMLKSRKKLKLSESNLTPEKDNAQAYVFDEKEYINKKLQNNRLLHPYFQYWLYLDIFH